MFSSWAVQPERFVDTVHCLCGQEIHVSVADYGMSVYCPTCGTEVAVGDRLTQPNTQQVKTASPGEPSHHTPTPTGRRRLIASPMGLIALLLIATATAAGSYLVWSNRSAISSWSGSVEPITTARSETNSPRDSKQANGAHDATRAPHQVQSITVAMISRLLQEADLEFALVQAQLWREALRDEGAARDDPRRVKLHQVLASLRQRLQPTAEPQAPIVQQFREATQTLADHLQTLRYQAAHEECERIERLLDEHSDMPTLLTEQYFELKASLRRTEPYAENVETIRRLLGQARETLDSRSKDRVTSALRDWTRAKFLARNAVLPRQAAAVLQQQADELRLSLQLARGQRAVADALRCHTAGDSPARNRQVRSAMTLLPGLPESEVQSYLEQVRPWQEAAREEDRNASQPPQPISTLGRTIERRDCYEQVLEAYGRGDGLALIQACHRYHDLLRDQNLEPSRLDDEFQEQFFDVIEANLSKLAKMTSGLTQDERRARQSELQSALELAANWNSLPRWQALHNKLEQITPGQGHRRD